MMEWNEILQLRSWSSLSEIGEDFEMVLDGVYQVGLNSYVLTQPDNEKYEKNDPLAPFVTKAYWAPNMNALKKLILRDPPIEVENDINSCPKELLLGTTGKYSELGNWAIENNVQFSERAIYTNKGKFNCKVFDIGRFEYCFLNRKDDYNEQFFAVKVSLIRQ